MKRRFLFFDLDDTLYDRGVPFRCALEQFGMRIDAAAAAELSRRCKIRGQEVFQPSQDGSITMDEMYIYRYKNGFADCGIAISDAEALSFQALYAAEQNHIVLDPFIADVLTRCRNRYAKIGLITNGPGAHQREKISTLGLERWIDPALIFISGEIGITKPDPRIFCLASTACRAEPEDLTYVGDDPATDTEPAGALGWNTVLVNMSAPEGYRSIAL